ncbi:hypothetical protein HC891_16270, partial [Candidatus Gracilibacteria bacterium]|nr:hypothetical protein [Candidatus Gracilibacteria bacterium]
MHQRMAFFNAPNGRFLILGFYGFAPVPNDGSGIGRVVREILPDGDFGPIFFLRYNRHAGWNEANTSYPLYRTAPDAGFVAACDMLLADRLVTLQWWEEDRSSDGFYAVEGQKALAAYRRPDGTVVGIWKGALSALSSDGGKTWSQAVTSPTIITNGAKVWGQRTADGGYVLAYNPVADNNHRWPLALVTGDDGITFDQLATVHGEVPCRRYAGIYKDSGPQYVRGIEAFDTLPAEQALWLTYSVNKEDLWVSRVPLPVRSTVQEPVCDTFDAVVPGPDVPLWNIYSPQWAQVAVVAFPSTTDHSLELRDQDPYDYARAIRVFPECQVVSIAFRLYAHQINGQLEIEIQDRYGARPIGIYLNEAGALSLSDGATMVRLGQYRANSWYSLRINIDSEAQRYRLSINSDEIVAQASFAEQVSSVERLSFRTGPYRTRPDHNVDFHQLLDQPIG